MEKMIPHRVIWKAVNGTTVTRSFVSKEAAMKFAANLKGAIVQPATQPVPQRVTSQQALLHKRRFGEEEEPRAAEARS